MNLREPKKKRRIKVKDQPPFPIVIGDKNEWVTYTAYLTEIGSCIINPNEIAAVHSMGYFGKGSLSRGFPSFGKARYGAPPVIRNRQWVRRQEWLKQFNELSIEPNNSKCIDSEENKCEQSSIVDLEDGETSSKSLEIESTSNIIENTSDIIENTPDIIENTPDIIENTQDVIVNTQDIIENTQDVIKNTQDVIKNTQDVIKNTQDIIENTQDIVENTPDIIENTPDIIEIDTNVDSSGKNQEDKSSDKEIEISQINLGSTREDDICVIVNKNINDKSEGVKDNGKDSNESEEKEEPYYLEAFDFKGDLCIANNDTDVQNKLLVLPDSDSDNENYLKNIKPKVESESFPVQETLHLTFEETFFLLYGLGCLNLIDFDGNLLDIDSAWHFFCKADKSFVQKYVVYHYFRSKGWVVKPGLKYGGDFLLYKQGPPFYHASYIVIVDVLEGDSLIRDESKSMHKPTWNNLFGLERLSETAAKEILFAQVLWPSSVMQSSNLLCVDALSEFSVRELLWRRWNPKNNKDDDDADYDSW